MNEIYKSSKGITHYQLSASTSLPAVLVWSTVFFRACREYIVTLLNTIQYKGVWILKCATEKSRLAKPDTFKHLINLKFHSFRFSLVQSELCGFFNVCVCRGGMTSHGLSLPPTSTSSSLYTSVSGSATISEAILKETSDVTDPPCQPTAGQLPWIRLGGQQLLSTSYRGRKSRHLALCAVDVCVWQTKAMTDWGYKRGSVTALCIYTWSCTCAVCDCCKAAF